MGGVSGAGGRFWMGRFLLWAVRERAMKMLESILSCGARDDGRLGERGNVSVASFCYWSRCWQAVVAAAATSEGDEGRRYWWIDDRNRSSLYDVVSSSCW